MQHGEERKQAQKQKRKRNHRRAGLTKKIKVLKDSNANLQERFSQLEQELKQMRDNIEELVSHQAQTNDDIYLRCQKCNKRPSNVLQSDPSAQYYKKECFHCLTGREDIFDRLLYASN